MNDIFSAQFLFSTRTHLSLRLCSVSVQHAHTPLSPPLLSFCSARAHTSLSASAQFLFSTRTHISLSQLCQLSFYTPISRSRHFEIESEAPVGRNPEVKVNNNDLDYQPRAATTI